MNHYFKSDCKNLVTFLFLQDFVLQRAKDTLVKIEYESDNFPPGLGRDLQGRNELHFSASELLWAAITVGRAHMMDVTRYGVFSDAEILYRAAIVIANLAIDEEGRVIKSDAYIHLDPSEKGAVSYFLGLTFTKLLASRKLDCPWLLHLDVYRHLFPILPALSRSRPDLIGRDITNRPIVFESKGRTNKKDSGILAVAKRQAELVTHVAGRPTYLNVGVVTHFIHNRLVVNWSDPPPSKKGFKLETTDEEYLKLYYQLVYNFLRDKKTERRGNFVVHYIESVDLAIGLDQRVYNTYEIGPLSKIKFDAQNTVRATFDVILEQDSFIGKDGILITAGEHWGNKLSANRPKSRRG